MTIKIKIILGSTREGRFGDKPAKWIFEEAKKMKGMEAELIDLRDYPLPFFDQPISPSRFNGVYPNKIAAQLAKKIGEADGFIIVSPEYNHGYPAVLKNALDWIYDGWNKKPVGFVSYGGVGGARVVEQLKEVVIDLQMAPIREAIHIQPQVYQAVSRGEISAFETLKPAMEKFLNQLLWWARALKAAREQK